MDYKKVNKSFIIQAFKNSSKDLQGLIIFNHCIIFKKGNKYLFKKFLNGFYTDLKICKLNDIVDFLDDYCFCLTWDRCNFLNHRDLINTYNNNDILFCMYP